MRGMPQNPMSTDDIVCKFRSNVSDLMPAVSIDRIVDIVMSLDRLDDLQPLMTALH
jgi:hypothetical protein